MCCEILLYVPVHWHNYLFFVLLNFSIVLIGPLSPAIHKCFFTDFIRAFHVVSKFLNAESNTVLHHFYIMPL